MQFLRPIPAHTNRRFLPGLLLLAFLILPETAFSENSVENDIRLEREGKVQTFESLAYSKSKGIDFLLNVPESWKFSENSASDIVGNFTQNNPPNSDVLFGSMILISENLPGFSTISVLKPLTLQALYERSLQDLKNKFNYRILNSEQRKFGTENCFRISYQKDVSDSRYKAILVYFTRYCFIVGTKFVFIDFSYFKKAKESEVIDFENDKKLADILGNLVMATLKLRG